MKIKSFRFREVIVPAKKNAVNHPSLDRPLHKLPIAGKSGWSIQFDQVPKLLLEVELENGIVGLGEFYRGHDWATIEGVSQAWLGKSIHDLNRQRLPMAWCREYDGFECAIWDAYAKLLKVRCVDLLGGAVRERIKIGAWLGHRLTEELPSLVGNFQRQGYDCVKFKCDLGDDIVSWCQTISDSCPEMKIILDPNERWDRLSEAKIRARNLEKIGNILCLEDPIPRWKLSEFRDLREFSVIPIVLHVSLPYVLHGQKIADAVQAIELRAVDGFNFNGGFANFQRLDHISHAAGLPCWHGSEVDLGILEAMYVHSVAAAESSIWPSDIFGRLIREHDLLTEPLKFEPPFALLPGKDKYGLGVEIDSEAIKFYHKNLKELYIR